MTGSRGKESGKRILLRVVAILAVAAICAWIAVHALRWQAARQMMQSPRVTMPLRPLTQTGVAVLRDGGMAREALGFAFVFPWSASGVREHTSGSTVTFQWPQGHLLVLEDSAIDRVFFDAARKLPEAYDADILRSAYDYKLAQLSETGSEVGFLRSDATNAQAHYLMMLKGMAMYSPKPLSAIYRLSAGDVRGFQLGDPSRDMPVKLHLFDREDRELTVTIFHRQDTPAVTQEEINAFVASVRPAAR